MHADGASSTDTAEIRRMSRDDLIAVHAMEARCYPEPWPLGFFQMQLERIEDALCLVAEAEGGLVGYLIAERYIDVWHLMNLCVDTPWRRRGVASSLLEVYFSAATWWPHRGHILEVRVSNDGARALYRKVGFVAVGIRPHYYSGDGEDAVSMWRDRTRASS